MQTKTTQSQPKKLLDQVRDKIRFKHYSLSTENTYLSWIKQFILYHGKRHPVDMGAAEVDLSCYVAPRVQFNSESGAIRDTFFVSRGADNQFALAG